MNKKYVVKQSGLRDCASCCLLSIIRYNNGNVSKSELEYLILFSFILCLLVFQKYLIEVPGTSIHLGLTYSATCQIYWVIWDFPVLSPDRDILCFAQKID